MASDPPATGTLAAAVALVSKHVVDEASLQQFMVILMGIINDDKYEQGIPMGQLSKAWTINEEVRVNPTKKKRSKASAIDLHNATIPDHEVPISRVKAPGTWVFGEDPREAICVASPTPKRRGKMLYYTRDEAVPAVEEASNKVDHGQNPLPAFSDLITQPRQRGRTSPAMGFIIPIATPQKKERAGEAGEAGEAELGSEEEKLELEEEESNLEEEKSNLEEQKSESEEEELESEEEESESEEERSVSEEERSESEEEEEEVSPSESDKDYVP